MDPKRRPHRDREAARLAQRQHGVVTTGQLLGIGFSADEIHNRLRSGRLITIHRGVHAVGHLPSTLESRWMAAVLAAGEGAVLSHDSAALLWQIRDRGSGAVHVTCPRGRRARHGIVVHRGLEPGATAIRKGIAVTTPLQTLLDLATRPLTARELARAVHEAQVRGLVTHDELAAAVGERRGRRGTARLRRILADGPARTRSDLEELGLRFLARHGFPRPETNVDVHGWEVDMRYPRLRLVIEIQSDRYHGTRYRRRLDAQKQTALEAAGERVLAVWDFQLERDDPATVSRIGHVLEERRRRFPS